MFQTRMTRLFASGVVEFSGIGILINNAWVASLTSWPSSVPGD